MKPKKGKMGLSKHPSSVPSSSAGRWSVGSRLQNSWRTLFVVILCTVLAATTLMIDQIFEAARTSSVNLMRGISLPMAMVHPNEIVEDRLGVMSHSSGLLLVRDIVAFPDEVMLLVEAGVRGEDTGSSLLVRSLPRKEDVFCLFGRNHRTGILSVDWKDDSRNVLAVRCEHPPPEVLDMEFREATLYFSESKFVLPSSVEYSSNSSWKVLVYESVTLPHSNDVLLFAKGLLDTKGKPNNFSNSLHKLHCQFGSPEDGVQTKVKLIAQEVVRCELPPANLLHKLDGAKVSLFVRELGGLLRSVAYFSLPSSFSGTPKALRIEPGHQNQKSKQEPKFHICSCTMLWNQAAFLREWIMYHGFLGVERWYIYDNNSDDDLEEVLAGLQPDYNVSRHPWPWLKTQEAGFSHCAIRARADCKWVAFFDVDEFVYPAKYLYEFAYKRTPEIKKVKNDGRWTALPLDFSEPFRTVDGPSTASWWERYQKTENFASRRRNKTSILRKAINKTVKEGKEAGKRIGEVRLVCHNFGPSGNTRAPTYGVMTGYTCRMEWPERHKSFVLLDALSDSLMNVVHHFKLREGYKEMAINSREAVINHYKYQAWEVFKAKFVRRVATYVVDWHQQTANSHDRAPGLGQDGIEPKDWASQYCEQEDQGLRNFTWTAFRDPESGRLPWVL